MIYIDTETTGTGDDAEILEIAIVDDAGTVLLDTYLTPMHIQEWPNAQKRHGISPEFIFGGGFPTAKEVENTVLTILSSDDVVMYNVDFDRPIIIRTFDTGQLLDDALCCMDWFAQYRGEPATKPYHKNGFRSWKLTEAAEYSGFNWEGKPHGALADAKATQHVWNWLVISTQADESEHPGQSQPTLTPNELAEKYRNPDSGELPYPLTDDEAEKYRIERSVQREEEVDRQPIPHDPHEGVNFF